MVYRFGDRPPFVEAVCENVRSRSFCRCRLTARATIRRRRRGPPGTTLGGRSGPAAHLYQAADPALRGADRGRPDRSSKTMPKSCCRKSASISATMPEAVAHVEGRRRRRQGRPGALSQGPGALAASRRRRANSCSTPATPPTTSRSAATTPSSRRSMARPSSAISMKAGATRRSRISAISSSSPTCRRACITQAERSASRSTFRWPSATSTWSTATSDIPTSRSWARSPRRERAADSVDHGEDGLRQGLRRPELRA